MTQLTFKSKINDSQMSILLHLLKSWNIEAEMATTSTAPKIMRKKPDSLTLSVGMWEDRNISDKQLRELAWGTVKRQKNDTLRY